MCHIDATDFVQLWADNPEHFSDSAHKSGLQNIGEITWRNAMAHMSDSDNWLFNDIDCIDLVRDHFREYGAWEREEIEGWDMQTLNAMLAQEVASEMQKDSQDEWMRLSVDEEKKKYYFHIGV